MTNSKDAEGLAWQVGVWDRMAPVYAQEVDQRFIPVVDQVLLRAKVQPGQDVLDLGTGTGAVALRVARLVGAGKVVAVDVSPEMLRVTKMRAEAAGLTNVSFNEGRAESLPVDNASTDVIIASLSLMYVIDRPSAAREVARVLRPDGRLVAAVWAGPDQCDIVKFQQTAGSFAPPPPVPGVGPGAMADTRPFLDALNAAGLKARVETEALGFTFDTFESAWDVLTGVTTASLTSERREEAKAAVRAAMWPAEARGPRYFRNVTQFIVAERPNARSR